MFIFQMIFQAASKALQKEDPFELSRLWWFVSGNDVTRAAFNGHQCRRGICQSAAAQLGSDVEFVQLFFSFFQAYFQWLPLIFLKKSSRFTLLAIDFASSQSGFIHCPILSCQTIKNWSFFFILFNFFFWFLWLGLVFQNVEKLK